MAASFYAATPFETLCLQKLQKHPPRKQSAETSGRMADLGLPQTSLSSRVHVPNNWVLRVLVIVIVIIIQVLGKDMFIRYLDP